MYFKFKFCSMYISIAVFFPLFFSRWIWEVWWRVERSYSEVGTITCLMAVHFIIFQTAWILYSADISSDGLRGSRTTPTWEEVHTDYPDPDCCPLSAMILGGPENPIVVLAPPRERRTTAAPRSATQQGEGNMSRKKRKSASDPIQTSHFAIKFTDCM